MNITCPKCKTKIPVKPGALMGSIKSEAKAVAARLNAQRPRPNRKPRTKKKVK